MTTTQTTATRTLAFSPLTQQGLRELGEESARRAANNLTFHCRYTGTLEEDAAKALPHAVRYSDMLNAAMARYEAERSEER